MEYLFTYGTLQDLQVQQYIFNRTLSGKTDFLPGFKRMENAIYERYPLVLQTRNPTDQVEGKVYELTESELHKADVYETAAYKRMKMPLRSGILAWVYVENSN